MNERRERARSLSVHASRVALALTSLLAFPACSRPQGGAEPQDHPASPQASVMPAPLAPAQSAGSARVLPEVLVPLSDAGAPAVALHTYDELVDVAPAKDPPIFGLDFAFRIGDAPPLAKGAEVNGFGLDAARKKTELRAELTLSSTRMRLRFEGGGSLFPREVDVRARLDRLGHVAVVGGKYRALTPGTLRAFVGERRFDVGPLDVAEVIPRGEGPRRLGLHTRRVEIVARSAKVLVDLVHTSDLGEGGVMACRFVLDLASASPRTQLCGPEEIPVFAEYRWNLHGTFVMEATSFARLTDVPAAQLLVPPTGAVRADDLLPRERAGRFLGPPELRAFRHGDPTAMAELEVSNPTTALTVVYVDGVAVAWVAPAAQLTLFGLAPGRYQVAYRSVLGDLSAPLESIAVPGKSVWGMAQDAGK